MNPISDGSRWSPRLEHSAREGIGWWSDPAALSRGIVIAFSERTGGVSETPYASLNMAAHVGDDLGAVRENRLRLLEACGLADSATRLTMAEQVHGDRIAVVGAPAAGAGAHWDGGVLPIPGTDALITAEEGVPLMLCFADCVPVVLVAPGPAVAVVHAGWRGALAGVVGKAVHELARTARSDPAATIAYIGPHIGPSHYVVSGDIMSQFCNTFGTFARAVSGGLDLDAVVTASLVDAGVSPCSIARLGTCTADATDRFFSYRAEDGRTGRHSAFACVRSGASSLTL
jgi:polyphenol oxidase